MSPTLKAVEGGRVKSSSSIWMKVVSGEINCLSIFTEAKWIKTKVPKPDLKPRVIAVGQNIHVVFCT